MDSRRRFHAELKRRFAPILLSEGFEERGRVFRRRTDEIVDVAEVRVSKHGGKCCVDLGMHPLCVELHAGMSAPPPEELTVADCAFIRTVEGPDGHYPWFPYGEDEAATQRSVASLCDAYRREGPAFFARLRSLPGFIADFEPEQIRAADLSEYPGFAGPARAAWIIAQIWRHLGQVERSREFAAVGLQCLGRAVALREPLLELCGEAG